MDDTDNEDEGNDSKRKLCGCGVELARPEITLTCFGRRTFASGAAAGASGPEGGCELPTDDKVTEGAAGEAFASHLSLMGLGLEDLFPLSGALSSLPLPLPLALSDPFPFLTDEELANEKEAGESMGGTGTSPHEEAFECLPTLLRVVARCVSLSLPLLLNCKRSVSEPVSLFEVDEVDSQLLASAESFKARSVDFR